jgi:hypothetical protein
MTDRSPRRKIFKKNWPHAYAVYEINEIDNADTFTAYGFDPNEDVFAKAVMALDKSDEVTVTVSANVVTMNDAGLNDSRIIIFVFGLTPP